MSEVDVGDMRRLIEEAAAHRKTAWGSILLKQAADELERLRAYRKRLQGVVDLQAEDEALWFIAQTAPEAHLQEELRRLHWHIEREE